MQPVESGTGCIGEFAQEPLEPPRGFWTVRKLVAPPPNYDVDGSLVALLSHQPAIFAQRPRATRWLQRLFRKLSIKAHFPCLPVESYSFSFVATFGSEPRTFPAGGSPVSYQVLNDHLI